MSGKERPPRIASCEDADESDNIIEGTFRCAASTVASPSKEKPNTGRTRRDKRRDSASHLTDSDSTVHPRGDLLRRSSTRDREKPVSNHKKAMIPTQPMRPPAKHARTAPPNMHKREIEASYYGVSPTVTTPATSRPRAQARPVSYYGSNPSRPPLANTRFYASQQPMPPTSFPPPSWSSGAAPYAPSPSPVVTHQPHDYFSRPLEDRFASSARPQSSIGFRPPTRNISYGGDYDDDHVHDKSLARPPPSRRLSKVEDDRRMPPPPRRAATVRPVLPFRPPPGPSTPGPGGRRNVIFNDEDLNGDTALFQDISPFHQQDYAPVQRSRSKRRPSIGATSTYDVGDFRTEVAGRASRRHSYYGKSGSSGSGYEEKIRKATIYQEETGGPAVQLTAETLRKAGRNGGSSRSTRSSGSHDESDYRQSATTRTTRSSNDEDVTIRVVGSAVLKVGGAEVQCKDGAEVNIASRTLPNYRSDKSSYNDYDERRPRIERPPTRTRTSSQSGSYARSMPKYDLPLGYSHSPYHQDIPPYPAYPSYDGGWL